MAQQDIHKIKKDIFLICIKNGTISHNKNLDIIIAFFAHVKCIKDNNNIITIKKLNGEIYTKINSFYNLKLILHLMLRDKKNVDNDKNLATNIIENCSENT